LKKAPEADLRGELNRGRPNGVISSQFEWGTSEWGTFGGADLYEANPIQSGLEWGNAVESSPEESYAV